MKHALPVAATNGQAAGSVPGNRTTDHWLNAFVGFSLSF
jgi:hypothetical protein